jgi:mannose-6-phosphate isomerase-like protein (cupin superfamily)
MEWTELEGYKKRILAGESELGQGNLVQVVRIGPGQEVRPHYHRQQTEFFYILKGRALLSIAENKFEAKAGDTYLCRPKDIHRVKNEGTEDFELIVFKTNWSKDDSYW